ncbi:MAG: hypothetical protein ACLP1X_29505 [Polyangiaceae bacterium]
MSEPRPAVERTVARFSAAEIGGAAHPRFIEERMLAFEARLEVMAEKAEGTGDAYQERHVRDALERHVGEELLANLANKLIMESPPSKRPTEAELTRIEQDLGAAELDRLGGRERVEAAAAVEQLDPSVVDALLRRQAMSAWYLDRAVTPILQPSDEQLREVFRSSAHPFRGQPFEQSRTALRRWFVAERLHAAESAFFQAARAHVRIIVSR